MELRKVNLKSPAVVVILVAGAYAALVLLLCHGCLSKYFAMEDFFHIGWVGRHGLKGVAQAFVSPNEYGLYRPLTIQVYFYLCRLAFGLEPFGYHLVNMVSQIANGMLVFLLVLALVRKRWVAFVAGVVYLTRMSHYLGVFWVSGIQEVWLTFFYLLSFLLFHRFVRTDRQFFFFASLGGYLMALASKESAVTLPLALLVYGALFDEQFRKRVFPRYGVFCAIALLFIAVKLVYLRTPANELYHTGPGPWVLKNLLGYSLWQVNLSHLVLANAQLFTRINPYSLILRDYLWPILGGAAGLLFLSLAIFRKRLCGIKGLERNDPYTRLLIMGGCLFLISVLPALGLKYRLQHFYLFVPSVGFSMCASALIGKYLSKPVGVFVVALIVAGAFWGYALMDKIPDGRTSMSGKRFLEDLNAILKKEENASTVYVKDCDTLVYQVLWFGEAFETFVDRPVTVVFDFQDPDFSGGEATLEAIYEDGRLRTITGPHQVTVSPDN